jgi:hypothetical protein
MDPRGLSSANFEINANLKRVERLVLFNPALERPPPDVKVILPRDPNSPVLPQINPEYARQLVPIALAAIDDYSGKLSLPVPRPLTTNHVARFSIADNGGWPHCEIELTNGWRFTYRNRMVNGYDAPDRLFSSKKPILIKDFIGKWNLTEADSMELVRSTLAKLNCPTNLVHFEVEPQVVKPSVPGIPRYQFFWYFNRNDELESAIWAEVDADKGAVKSLYYDHKAYWNHAPSIDVPLSLPLSETNAASPAPIRRGPVPTTPQRPFKVLPP